MGIETPVNNPDNSAEQELSLETKKQLVDFWTANVVDGAKPPENLDNEALKTWLYETTMASTAELAQKWNLIPDENLIKKIEAEKDIYKKAKLEFKYLESMQKLVDKLNITPEESAPDSYNKWNTYPKAIEESKMFNCVGSTLLGINLLDKAGIESYQGGPVGHSVNVVKLADGSWVYLDLVNKILTKISTFETTVGRNTFLNFQNSEIEYRQLVLKPKTATAGSIIGNFGAFLEEENDTARIKHPESNPHIYKIKEELAKLDFDKVNEQLYPENKEYRVTMEEERKIIKTIRKIVKNARRTLDSLSEEQKNAIRLYAMTHQKEMLDLIQDKIMTKQPDKPGLSEFLRVFRDGLEEARRENPRTYDNVRERLREKMESKLRFSHLLSQILDQLRQKVRIKKIP